MTDSQVPPADPGAGSDPRLVSYRFSMNLAVHRIAIPEQVVPVRDYAGENETQALQRSGFDDPAGTQFIHFR